MRVNPVTRTPTPRYAPGRRRRACHQTPTRIRGPTRESADPRANERVHVRGEERRQLALGAVSHAIRLSELSTASTNVAILTTWMRGTTQCRWNCMRHSWDSSPGGSHTPPLALPLVAQPVARQWPGTVDTAEVNNLPKPHHDRSRDHAQARTETTTSNTNFPTPTRRKVTPPATRSVL